MGGMNLSPPFFRAAFSPLRVCRPSSRRRRRRARRSIWRRRLPHRRRGHLVRPFRAPNRHPANRNRRNRAVGPQRPLRHALATRFGPSLTRARRGGLILLPLMRRFPSAFHAGLKICTISTMKTASWQFMPPRCKSSKAMGPEGNMETFSRMCSPSTTHTGIRSKWNMVLPSIRQGTKRNERKAPPLVLEQAAIPRNARFSPIATRGFPFCRSDVFPRW